jgi:hypothetical protein
MTHIATNSILNSPFFNTLNLGVLYILLNTHTHTHTRLARNIKKNFKKTSVYSFEIKGLAFSVFITRIKNYLNFLQKKTLESAPHLHVSESHLHVSESHLHVSEPHLHVSESHLHVSEPHLHVSEPYLHVSEQHENEYINNVI